jgi:hypothetical protein
MTAAHLGASAACVRSANAETLESGYCSRCLCVIGPMTDNLRQSSHPIDFGRGGAQIDMTSAIDIERGLRALPSARRRRAVRHRSSSGRAQDGRLVRPLQHHVQLVHVHAGGQAVVGMVETPGGTTPCEANCPCTTAHDAEPGQGAGAGAGRQRCRTAVAIRHYLPRHPSKLTQRRRG